MASYTADKESRKRAARKYYADNREVAKQRVSKYRKANPEKIKALKDKWYERRRSPRTHTTPEAKLARKKEMERAYRLKNKDQLAARSREYAIKNKERVQANQKQYYAENREKLLALNKAWRIANSDKENARLKKRYLDSPDTFKAYRKNRRAKQKSATIGDTKLIFRWESGWRKLAAVRCYYCCELKDPIDCHADHMQPLACGGAHSIENLCIACAPCNLSKNSKTVAEFNSRLVSPVLLL